MLAVRNLYGPGWINSTLPLGLGTVWNGKVEANPSCCQFWNRFAEAPDRVWRLPFRIVALLHEAAHAERHHAKCAIMSYDFIDAHDDFRIPATPSAMRARAVHATWTLRLCAYLGMKSLGLIVVDCSSSRR